MRANPVYRKIAPVALSLAAAALAGEVSCSASHSGQNGAPNQPASADGSTEAGTAFQADPPAVYVAKVKNLLVGLAPTDSDVKTVQADPTQLASLIQGWMALPQYSQKMMRFFELAFQQTQVSATDFADQAYPKQIAINGSVTPLLVQNAQESFARTMLALVAQNRPLTDAMSTGQLMMTTAMKELYAFLDMWEVDDNGKVTDAFRKANPTLDITIGAAQGPIPQSESFDPTSANYMHFYDPDVTIAYATVTGCQADPVVLPALSISLHYLLYGSIDGRKTSAGIQCPPFGGTPKAPLLTPADFSDWTMVDIRPPKAGESTTRFFDLPTLRQASELVLNLPRVGFFSTPAFFANWPTNTSNTMRVTMHQALIVATGSSIDGTDLTTPPGTPGLDMVHANQAACFGCHKILDPARSIFSATWSWNYHAQLDTTWTSELGMFAFRGVVQSVKSLSDFGGVLAAHPLFASGWVQRLCYYANSSPCDPTDPLFHTIVSDFQSSGFAWNALVKELLSSPMVTNASETQTARSHGEVVAVSRRDHICASFDARLGFSDVCNLLASSGKATTTIPEIVSGLPSDAYGRGAVAPILPNQPSLFFRAATENICEGIATQVIDVPAAKQVPGTKQWSSAQPDAAIADFVNLLMGLTPSDPRSAPATTLLKSHFTTAMAQAGITATSALQSTFVTACLAPSAISIGM